MAFRETSDFDAPIPGMSLTHELGARPWQTPSQMNTVEEGIDFYISRLVDRNMAGRLLDIIETGVPLTAIAETLTLGGVMQGLMMRRGAMYWHLDYNLQLLVVLKGCLKKCRLLMKTIMKPLKTLPLI